VLVPLSCGVFKNLPSPSFPPQSVSKVVATGVHGLKAGFLQAECIGRAPSFGLNKADGCARSMRNSADNSFPEEPQEKCPASPSISLSGSLKCEAVTLSLTSPVIAFLLDLSSDTASPGHLQSDM